MGMFLVGVSMNSVLRHFGSFIHSVCSFFLRLVRRRVVCFFPSFFHPVTKIDSWVFARLPPESCHEKKKNKNKKRNENKKEKVGKGKQAIMAEGAKERREAKRRRRRQGRPRRESEKGDPSPASPLPLPLPPKRAEEASVYFARNADAVEKERQKNEALPCLPSVVPSWARQTSSATFPLPTFFAWSSIIVLCRLGLFPLISMQSAAS